MGNIRLGGREEADLEGGEAGVWTGPHSQSAAMLMSALCLSRCLPSPKPHRSIKDFPCEDLGEAKGQYRRREPLGGWR